MDLLELVDLFLSWRLYAGIALTAIVCLLLALVLPSQSAQLAVCIPIGSIGVILSFRWQIRADSIK